MDDVGFGRLTLEGLRQAHEAARHVLEQFDQGAIPRTDELAELVSFIQDIDALTVEGEPVRSREQLERYIAFRSRRAEAASRRKELWSVLRAATDMTLVGTAGSWTERLLSDARELTASLLDGEELEAIEGRAVGVVAFVGAARARENGKRDTLIEAARRVESSYGEEAREALLIGEASVPPPEMVVPTEEEGRALAGEDDPGRHEAPRRAEHLTVTGSAGDSPAERANEPSEDLAERFDIGLRALERATASLDRVARWTSRRDPAVVPAVLEVSDAATDLKQILLRFPVAGAEAFSDAGTDPAPFGLTALRERGGVADPHQLTAAAAPVDNLEDTEVNGVVPEPIMDTGDTEPIVTVVDVVSNDAPTPQDDDQGERLESSGSLERHPEGGPDHEDQLPDGPAPEPVDPTAAEENANAVSDGDIPASQEVDEETDQCAPWALGEPEPSLPEVDLAWSLVASGQVSIAWQLAERFTEVAAAAPVSLLKLATIGVHVREPDRALASSYAEAVAEALQETWPDSDEVALLAFAAGLVPSITAPSTGSAGVLDRAIDRLQRTARFAPVVAIARTALRFAQRGYPLNLSLLRQVLHRSSVEDSARTARAELEHWYHTVAPNLSTAYPTATRAWQHWLGPTFDSGFRSWMDSMRAGERGVARRVLQQVELWRDPAYFSNMLERTVQEVGNPHARRTPVVGKARRALERNVHLALDLFETWAQFEARRESGIAQFLETAIDDLRVGFRDHAQAALQTLADETSDQLGMRATMGLARTVLTSLDAVFDAQGSFERREPTIERLRGWDAAVAGIPVGPDGSIEHENAAELLDALRVAAEETVNLRGRIEAFLAARDARTAAFLVDQPASSDSQGVEQLRDQVNAIDDSVRSEMCRDLEILQVKVERAASIDVLDEASRRSLATRVAGFLSQLRNDDQERRFSDDVASVAALAREYEAAEERALRSRRDTLERLKPRISSSAHQRIRDVLEARDLVTADEYMLVAEEGRELPAHEPSRNVLGDYVQAQAALAKHLAEPRAAFVRKVRHRDVDADLLRAELTSERAEDAAKMLEAWGKLVEIGGPDRFEIGRHRPHLLALLEGFGFSPQELSFHRVQRKHGYVVMRVAPTANRARIPVPSFGSQSGGAIHVHLLWASSSEDAIFSAVGSDDVRRTRALVLYFGRLDLKRRRSLARTMRERKVFDAVVIDEMLTSFLACEPGDRLPVLFRAALPFGLSEPYSTLSGFVAPEMFYGRDEAKRSLVSRTGSSFVYGGRQLGKTALLREVARTIHEPNQGRIAVWLDLKHEAVGFSKPARSLVDDLMVRHLSSGDARVLHPNLKVWDKIRDGVVRYLDEGEQRQILLLLDEADAFLEADERTGFEVTTFLKGLMDQTHRRFKVVFAGLHNVQRTTRRANHPLAHLGEPICVGPLIVGEDWAAGMDLVRQPLAAVGYQIADDDVCRILALTNYFPSLIQLFCAHLTRHLNARPLRAMHDEPPVIVTSDHVEAVYSSRALRDEFRHKFDLTLQLDDRYEVLAYSVAYLTHTEPDRVDHDGFTVERIRDEALQYWPQGFESASGLDGFRALLEEMEGLGVIRAIGGNGRARGYALRNPNVMSLLGSADDITEKLLRPREVRVTYDPYTFRNTFAIEGAPWRAPLTVADEDQLREPKPGVTVLQGSPAAELARVPAFLSSAIAGSDSEYHAHLDDTATTESRFGRLLKDAVAGLKNQHAIVTVDSSLLWDARWLHIAKDVTSTASKKRLSMNVVFLADPEKVGYLVENASDVDRSIDSVMSLGRWSEGTVRAFLEDSHYGNLDADERVHLRSATGFWPAAMLELHEHARNAPHALLERAQEMANRLREPGPAASWLRFLTGEQEGLMRTLRVIADMTNPGEAIDVETFADLVGTDRATMRRALQWAERLGLVSKRGPETFELPPFVRMVAAHAGPEGRV